MQNIKQRAARKLNVHRRSRGTVWQPAYWDRFVRHVREYGDRISYIHENPVRKELVESAGQWRWSSSNNFSLDAQVRAACPIQLDEVYLPPTYRA